MKKIKKLILAALAAALMLTVFSLPAGAAASKYYIKSLYADINVRSGPGTEYEIVGKALVGAKYECLGSGFDTGGLTWYKLKCNVPDAWISSNYSRRYQYTISGDAEPALIDNSGSKVNAQFQEIINNTAEEYGASGIQIAVIRGSDGEMFTWSSGYATRNTEPMNDDVKIRVASISKAVVAMCAVKMQEQGIVDINEDVSEYWGEQLPKKITLANLLTHTSTLRYLSFKNSFAGTLQQLLQKASYTDGDVGAKTSFDYNNYAVGVAGSTLEVAADRTLNSYADEFLFGPLGVEATFMPGTFGEDVTLATLYESDGSVERTVPEARVLAGSEKPGYNVSSFAGGLTISAKDTAKLFSMLANNGKYGGRRVLSKNSVKEIETKYFKTSADGGKFSQCLPLRYVEKRYNTSKLYYHTGNAYGVLALASYNPDTKDTVVVLTIGADPKRDKYGVYNICSYLTKRLYKNMEKLGK